MFCISPRQVAYLPKAEALAAFGYRVLVYDGFGRGFSDRLIDIPVSLDVLVRQLYDFLSALQVKTPVVLYGTSLGAAIAARFARVHPQCTLAVGFDAPLIRAYPAPKSAALLRWPLLGQWLARIVLVPKVIARGEAIGVDAAGMLAARHFIEQFRVIGHEADLVSIITGDAVHGNRLPDHADIAQRGLPVHFAYALDDDECPAQIVEEAIALYRDPSVRTYKGGHFLEAPVEHFVEFLCSVPIDRGGSTRRSQPRRRRRTSPSAAR